ncbi:hypothetical protein ACK280_23950 [Mycobacterium sherrisii]|uniref:hypothetical protein n=1 Tax=Mycobacterium sherrisii TaxID=243061 RepID=UPI003975B4C9
MSSDEREIIDVEAVQISEDSNLPALVEQPVRTYRSDEPIQKQRDWPHGPLPERRCVAHRKNGDRCKNAAIKGATVCRYHGGAAKHVKAAARARLENAADLMAKELLRIALTADSEGVALAAVKDALDRAGLKPPAEVVLSQGETKPYEQVFDVIGGSPSDTSAAADCTPPPTADSFDAASAYGDTEYAGLQSISEENRQPSSDSQPLREAERREDTRERDAQPRQSARPQRTQARPETHITGMAAIQIANAANREAGVFEEQRAIESPHKRYRRP